MSLKSTLLVATAMVSYFGLASAQNVPLTLSPAALKPLEREADPVVAALPQARAAKPAPAARAESGFKLVKPQQADARPAQAPQNSVDESALRYYASQTDTARVAAEIRRLKTLHPVWQPPENLFSTSTVQVDEQRLWQLFSLGQFDDVATEIQALQAEYPDYAPSVDLVAKLGAAQRRAGIVAASDQRDWEQVTALAADNQDLLVCREIDVLWRVAEAFASLEDKDQALEIYRYVLANCDNQKDRLSTVQKASLVMPIQSVEQLIAAGKRRKEGGTEFEMVRLDLVRRAIGALASGQSAQAPSERDFKLIEISARDRRNSQDAGLLGWYAFSTKDYAKARDWFKIACDTSKDPKLIEGYVLSLRNAGEMEKAQNLAYDNRAAGPLVRKAYIEVVSGEITKPTATALAAEPAKRFEELIDSEQSALGAQSLGWSLFRQNNFKSARSWFEKSTQWEETEEGVLGLALSLQRLGERKLYSEYLVKNKAKHPAIAKLASVDNLKVAGTGKRSRGEPGVPQAVIKESVALYEAGKYREAAEVMDRNQKRLNPGMNALRGWAHFKANNFAESEKIFKQYGHVKGSEEGEFLSYISGRSQMSKWYQ